MIMVWMFRVVIVEFNRVDVDSQGVGEYGVDVGSYGVDAQGSDCII